jgi:hypothetical protein
MRGAIDARTDDSGRDYCFLLLRHGNEEKREWHTMAKNKPNRSTQQARDGQVIAGVTKDLKSVASIPLDGDTYTPVALVALLQSRIDAANKVATTKAAWRDAITQYKAINTKTTAVVSGLKQYLLNVYGKNSPQLADFGFASRKVTTLTPEQKQQAVEKRAATRAARGTKGPVAKLAITGESVKLAALEAKAAQNAAPSAATPPAPAPAPTAAPPPAPPGPAPVPAPTVVSALASEPPHANGAPPAPLTPTKA